MRYAENTTVSASQTKYEIEKVLTNHGASHFATFTSPGEAKIGFRFKERNFLIPIPLPDPDDKVFTLTPEKRFERTPAQAKKAYEDEINRRWRCMLITVKSAVEMCEMGVFTIEQAFLAWTALPGGQTVGEALETQIDDACRGRGFLALMPAEKG